MLCYGKSAKTTLNIEWKSNSFKYDIYESCSYVCVKNVKKVIVTDKTWTSENRILTVPSCPATTTNSTSSLRSYVYVKGKENCEIFTAVFWFLLACYIIEQGCNDWSKYHENSIRHCQYGCTKWHSVILIYSPIREDIIFFAVVWLKPCTHL